MSCYDELPADFHDYWIQNLAYCLWHYTSLTKVFEKDGNDIIMYKIIVRDGKQILTTAVKYCSIQQNYSIEGERMVSITNSNGLLINQKKEPFGKRYLHYQQVLDYLWELDKPSTQIIDEEKVNKEVVL